MTREDYLAFLADEIECDIPYDPDAYLKTEVRLKTMVGDESEKSFVDICSALSLVGLWISSCRWTCMTLIFDVCEGNRILRNIFYINLDEISLANHKCFLPD